jgi:hypothetical protein
LKLKLKFKLKLKSKRLKVLRGPVGNGRWLLRMNRNDKNNKQWKERKGKEMRIGICPWTMAVWQFPKLTIADRFPACVSHFDPFMSFLFITLGSFLCDALFCSTRVGSPLPDHPLPSSPLLGARIGDRETPVPIRVAKQMCLPLKFNLTTKSKAKLKSQCWDEREYYRWKTVWMMKMNPFIQQDHESTISKWTVEQARRQARKPASKQVRKWTGKSASHEGSSNNEIT